VSISTSNTLYGWDLQAGQPMYQSARHSQVITSIIAINSMDVFATSSMDKTILFQAASTGRVKGILKGEPLQYIYNNNNLLLVLYVLQHVLL
jgi:WD40 repeat protein